MDESDGQGHMCFCETDGCNHGTTILPNTIIIAIFTILSMLAYYSISRPVLLDSATRITSSARS